MKTRRTLEDAFKAGYLAGFLNTGEGYNGEYPFGDKKLDPEQDVHWVASRDVGYQQYIKESK